MQVVFIVPSSQLLPDEEPLDDPDEEPLEPPEDDPLDDPEEELLAPPDDDPEEELLALPDEDPEEELLEAPDEELLDEPDEELLDEPEELDEPVEDPDGTPLEDPNGTPLEEPPPLLELTPWSPPSDAPTLMALPPHEAAALVERRSTNAICRRSGSLGTLWAISNPLSPRLRRRSSASAVPASALEARPLLPSI
jgi:hypothetical protein